MCESMNTAAMGWLLSSGGDLELNTKYQYHVLPASVWLCLLWGAKPLPSYPLQLVHGVHDHLVW